MPGLKQLGDEGALRGAEYICGATLNVLTTDVVGTTEPEATVYLELPGYQVSVLTHATSDFRFNDIPLAEGLITLKLRAVDKAGNEGSVVQLNVNVSVKSAELHGNIKPASGYLLFAPIIEPCSDESSESNSDSQESCNTQLSVEISRLLNLIQQTLERDKHDYSTVRTTSDFISAMRSQRYGTIIVIDIPSGESYLEGMLRKEISSQVASGSSFVLMAKHNGSSWVDIVGAKPVDNPKKITSVELPYSPASSEITFSLNGSGKSYN